MKVASAWFDYLAHHHRLPISFFSSLLLFPLPMKYLGFYTDSRRIW